MLEIEQRIEVMNCPTHGQREVKIGRLFGDWPRPTCDLCEAEAVKSRQQIEEAARSSQEAAKRERNFRINMANSRIPPRFEGLTLEGFIPASPSTAGVLEFCQLYASEFPNRLQRGASLILCGNTGTGKTHLACGIAQHVIRVHGKSATYFTVGRAFRMVKDTFRKESRKSEEEILASFREPDLLILDEIGVQYGSEAEKKILFEIVNERYEAIKPTIIISNLAMDSLSEFAGDRVIDRMKENGGKVLVFDWKSHRRAA